MAISYTRFKAIFGDLGITEWVKYNWLSNAGTARAISNEVIEAGYNPLAYVNDELYNHITKTINIWDEEWELGALGDDGENIPSSNQIRTTNYIEVIPNRTYYFKTPNAANGRLYDENKNFISNITLYANQTFIIPNNVYYLRFYLSSGYGTTYNNDICINESNPYINGNYFPYFEGEKFLVLAGEKDLSDLTYAYDGEFPNIFSSTIPDIDVKPYNGDITILCSMYEAIKPTYRASVGNMQICQAPGNNGITIKNPSYNNPSIFKTDMSGVMLYYQLATPVLVDL